MDNEAEYYRSVLDNLTGGFLSVDQAGRVVYGNPTAGRILHIPIGAVVGKPYRVALEPYPQLCDVIAGILESRKAVHRAEVSVRHGDSEMIIGYSTLLVRTPAGEDLGVGVIFQDLTMVLKKKASA